MRKVITIIGIIIIAFSFVSLILNTTNFLATKEISTNQTNVDTNPSQQKLLLSASDTKHISGIYSSINVYVLLNPSTPDQQFNISIGIIFPNAIYPACSDQINVYCGIMTKTVTASGTNSFQVNLQTNERSIKIPILTNGLDMPSSNIDREYYITVSSQNSFTYSYQTVANGRIWILVGIPVFVLGGIISVVGIVLKDSTRGKKLKTRSWQEPTLGGNSIRNSKSSFRYSKSSKNGSSSQASGKTKISSAVSCKKCGGVMPRNSQYCPHCYSKQ